MDLPKAYNHTNVEHKIYDLWLKSGYFNPDKLPNAKARPPYTIIMPPPNANAPLHIGHALFVTIEDILIRYQRMAGKRALWLPGTDHAGFETQVVFEKKLEKAGRSRFKMQRDEFYQEIWNFVQGNKRITEEGLRRLGASCDWSRNLFTLDERIVKIVYETFQKMYADGLIYRGNRIGNWCPKHQTALSDLETKYEARTEPFYYFKYGPFTIGTSRPETKFGDKYVVMHPADKRYAKYKAGDTFEAEWINGSVKATVIKDRVVDMKFGSGVMTITPAHDPADFEIAQRHGLDYEQVIDKRGRLLPIAGEFSGGKIIETRPKIVEKLTNKGLLEKIEKNYKHSVQLCYKCGSHIEPQIIPQWFVAMIKPLPDGRPSLRDMAVGAVKTGDVKFIPAHFEKQFNRWMESLRDWPISRQIWWGIPVPVYYCGGPDKATSPKIGWAGHIAPEVLSGKVRTYRLRDHGLKVGDKVAFENSETKRLFGTARITAIEQKTVGNIELPDNLHSGKYKTTKALIAAFKRLHSDTSVSKTTPVWVYDFTFQPFTAQDKKTGCGQIVVADKTPKRCPACGGKNFIADPDTFDTWFSSGQWPFAALLAQGGSKSKINNQKSKLLESTTRDFDTYFPTQVMETGWDILFFWVARMIMLSYYRTGKQPFSTVMLHGLVRDRDRQKISKSKGNVIDPLGVIDTYGTDALRFALIFSTAAGSDIPLSEDKIRGMKHFANKLWNIARFVLSVIPEAPIPDLIRGRAVRDPDLDSRPPIGVEGKLRGNDKLTPADRDILAKLNATINTATAALENLRLHEAAQTIYNFTWYELADKYLEASKLQFKNDKLKESTFIILIHCLIVILKLLHPFMPFVTEEIWSHLKQKDLLMIAGWPTFPTIPSLGRAGEKLINKT